MYISTEHRSQLTPHNNWPKGKMKHKLLSPIISTGDHINSGLNLVSRITLRVEYVIHDKTPPG